MSPPLVYLSAAARRQASALLPDRVVEREVEAAILNGQVRYQPRPLRVIGADWEAEVRREHGNLRPRPRAWRILRIERRTRDVQ